MRVIPLSLACGITWGAAVALVACTNAYRPQYGRAFLDMIASVYPGYRGRPDAPSVAVATADAIVDGAVAGAMVGCLYNLLTHRRASGAGPTLELANSHRFAS